MYSMFRTVNGKIIISIIALMLGCFFLGGCKGSKSSCEVNRPRSYSKIKKNKSNYGVLYDHKTKAVPKNYMIRNGK
jgi:hypothetical protein